MSFATWKSQNEINENVIQSTCLHSAHHTTLTLLTQGLPISNFDITNYTPLLRLSPRRTTIYIYYHIEYCTNYCCLELLENDWLRRRERWLGSTSIAEYLSNIRSTIMHSKYATLSHHYDHIHTYIHTYIRTYVRTHTHTHTHTYKQTYIHTYIQTNIHTYIHTNIHILSLYWQIEDIKRCTNNLFL